MESIIGTLLVPAADEEKSNVQQLVGAVEVLTAFVRQHGLRVVGVGEKVDVIVDNGAHDDGRPKGRRLGSTNWSQDRFWRKYRKVADSMRRPYKRTHFAARIGLVYGTFTNYLERWGPPPGYAGPGE